MTRNKFWLVISLLMVFSIGYILGYLTFNQANQFINLSEEVLMPDDLKPVEPAINDSSEPTTPAEKFDEVAFTVSTASLPDSQKIFLRTVGIAGDELVVTNAMLACAEVKIGAKRMSEVQNGAVPTAFEGIQLVGCL